MKPKKNAGASGRKKGSKRSQKSTPSADGSSNSKASETQSNQPPNVGAQNVPRGRKDDAFPSTSSLSNAVEKPRGRSYRRNQSTDKSKKNQRDSHNESQDSFPAEDQVGGGGQQQAYPPLPKCRAKNEPKTIKKEIQDLEVPTHGGSRRPRKMPTAVSSNKLNSNTQIKEVSGSQMPLKRATYESNLTIKFNPNKAIKKEADGSGPPFHRVLQTSGKKATNEPNLTIKHDSYKSINEAPQVSGQSIQRGLQTSGKKATYGSQLGPNKVTNNGRKSPEPPNQKGLQMPRNKALGKEPPTKSNTSMFNLDVIMGGETSAKLPGKMGSQNPRNKAPDQNKLIKTKVKDYEPPNQKGLQMPTNKALGKEPPTKSNTNMFSLDVIMGGETNAKLPGKRGSQTPRNTAPEPNLTEGRGSKPSNQKGLQMPMNKALGKEPPTKSNTSIFDLDNDETREETNAKLTVQRGSQNLRYKAPEPNLSSKIDPKNIIRTEGRGSKPSNQNGLQMPTNKALGKEPTIKSNTSMFNLDVIMRGETNAKLPGKRGSQNPKNTDFGQNLTIKIDPNRVIKNKLTDYEPPNQKVLQMPTNKALGKEPTRKSNTNMFNLDVIMGGETSAKLPGKSGSQNPRNAAHEPNMTEGRGSKPSNQKGFQMPTNKALGKEPPRKSNTSTIKEATNAKLPIQKGSQNSGNKAPADSNKRIRFDPNKIIKTEDGIAHWGSQNFKKAPDSNSWVKFNANEIAKNEAKRTDLTVQGGPQSSMTMAPSKDTSPGTLHLTQVAPASDLWFSLGIFDTDDEGKGSPSSIQLGTDSSRLETNPDPDMAIKQEVHQPEYTIPIDQNNQVHDSKAPPQCFDNQFNPNQNYKEELQEPPSDYYPPKINPNNATPFNWNQIVKEEVQEPKFDDATPFNWNQIVKEEVQDLPSYNATSINSNQITKEEVQDSNSQFQTSFDSNTAIKKEKRGSDLPLWNSDSLNCHEPQSAYYNVWWANFCAEQGIVNEMDPNSNIGFLDDASTAGNSGEYFNTPVQSHQSSDFPHSEWMASLCQTGSNGSGFIDSSLASHNNFASSLQSNPHYDGLAFAGNPDAHVSARNSMEEDAMDARLQAELASLYSDGGPMPEPEKQESAAAKITEAEIDARLQAELDSLPFVEPSVETDDFVDNLLSSLLNPDPQTTKPSIAVENQVVSPSNLPTAPTTSASSMVAANKVANLQRLPQPQQPVAGNKQRPLSQVPMVAQVTGLQGQVVSLTYTTAPDGLVTSVSTTATEMPLAQANELHSLTATQLHQILQSGQPYLALPMIVPGGQEEVELGYKDASGIIAPTGQAVEDEEVDYEEIGVAETFAEYWPSKLKFGMSHPDPVVETATLSSVELPDITYELALIPRTTRCLSALQLEAVVYACQAHEQILPSGERAGFLLGDGAGVGKGRTIAGIIADNFVKGRKRALWVSVSNDLKFDAERDLHDIGADDNIKVVTISKFRYSRIDSEDNENFKEGVIFCTYTALIGESVTANSKYKTRLRQLVCWLGKKFDGVIVFDECHKAKNLSVMNVGKSTKTGTTVMELQKLLPDARVVYASATGASEPRNMAYMVRLGLWGPGTAYSEFFDFVNTVEKRGIGAMEIVAMDMKLRGTYISRQLSFKEVSFRIEEVPISKEFRRTYNLSAELWAEINRKFMKACRLMCIDNRVQKIITCQFWCAHQRFFKNLCIASKVYHVVKMARQATRMGKAVVIGLQSTGESRTLEHLERHNGKLSSFVSTSKMIIQSFVERHFPAPKRDAFHRLLNTGEFEAETPRRPPRAKKAKMSIDWCDDDMDAEAEESDIEMYENTLEEDRLKSGRKRRGRPPKTEKAEKLTMQDRILQHLCNNMRAQDNVDDASYNFDNTKLQKATITELDVERCIRAREILLDKIDVLGKRLPPNTLDMLISELGGTGSVAEMTGRRGRVVREESSYRYESRCDNDTSMDMVNFQEKRRFMVGKKMVAIISEAASSGISLQSDKRVSNQRRRLHITLELPWSADRAIQQFGRTHRSNQVNSPEYVFIITDLAGERRFASTVAKRLESLGALTQGDRRATDARDLSQFNIDNSIGRAALESVMQELSGEKPLDYANVPASYRGDFLYDCSMAMAGVGMLSMREENKVKVFTIEKDSNNMSKFLNRILGCRVEVQNALFKFFLDKMYSLILQMKRKGHFDMGILDLDAHGACVKSVKLMRFIRKHATGTAATELHTVTVERGMSYDTALAKYRKEGRHDHEGFYVLQEQRHNKNSAIMCLQAHAPKQATTSSLNKVSLQLYRPNTGPQVRLETLGSILTRYVKVEPEAARDFWQDQYDVCLDKCSHIYWNGVCHYPAVCEVGLRVRPYHVLSGLMLPIWDRIEMILEKSGHKIQIIRVKTDVNKKIVGTVVPQGVYDALVADLSSDSIVESH